VKRTWIAVAVAAVAVLCTAGTCGTITWLSPELADVAGCPRTIRVAVSGVQDDVHRIQAVLPGLGDVEAVHYRWREARPRTCPDLGPMDLYYEGFAVLSAPRAAELRAAYPWAPADGPAVPAELAPFAPPNPAWQRSAAADTALDGTYRLDANSPTVYFTYLRN
jgi:hypothetical protein